MGRHFRSRLQTFSVDGQWGWFDDMTAQVIDKKGISVSSTSTMSSSSTSIDHSLPGLLEWMTNRPSKDWVLLVVGLASSHRLSPIGGRTKAHVKSPPNDWFHVVAGQCSPSDWVHVVAGQIFISEVLPVIEFMWWWKDSIFPAIEFVWWQDKLGTICNLTISMSHCLSICIRDGLLRLWNRVIKCKMVIMGWRLVSQTPGSLPLWHCAVRQFASVVQHNEKKNGELSHQVPRYWPHSTARWSPGHNVSGRPGLMVTLTTHWV